VPYIQEAVVKEKYIWRLDKNSDRIKPASASTRALNGRALRRVYLIRGAHNTILCRKLCWRENRVVGQLRKNFLERVEIGARSRKPLREALEAMVGFVARVLV
jgi:hypothetical protein